MLQIARLVFVFFVMATLAMYFFGDHPVVMEQPSAMSFEEFVRARGAGDVDGVSEDQIHQSYQAYLNEWQQGQMKDPVGSSSAVSGTIAGYKASWQRVYAVLSMPRAVESPRIRRVLADMGVWVTFIALVSGIVAVNTAIRYLEQKVRK
jgi:hypothetical protein